MIIRHLTLHHFLAYYGDQTLALPTDGERTLTVVVGPNNSGKTSIIRGLKFWFYGERGLMDGSKPVSLLSNRAKAKVEVGGTLHTWVEVCFERDGQRGKESHTLRRTIEAKRVGENQWDVRSISLAQVGGGARPVLRPDEGNKYQRMLDSLVPPVLFDAFYFKGEPLDGKLLGDVSSIREALGQFLHEDQWKEAEKAATEIREDLGKEQARLTAANKALTQKLKEQQQNQLKLEQQQAALRDDQIILAKAEEDYAALTQELSQLGDVEAGKELKTRHSAASRRAEAAKNVLLKTDADIQREIGQSLGLPFLVGAVGPVRAILVEMEEDNVLPADVTPGFVDRVLQGKKCICGRVHNDDSRANWEDYRRKALQADAGQGLQKLLDWVKPTGRLSIEKRSEYTRQELKRLLELRHSSARELNDSGLEVTAIQMEMEKVPLEDIARIGKGLNELQSTIQSQNRRIKVIEDAVAETQYTGRRLKDEVDDLSRKSGVDQGAFQKLSEARDRADRLLQALKFCRGRLSEYFHRVLQQSVAAFYDSKATDGSKASIDRQTLRPSILVQGSKTNSLGGGQSQLLALAYVVSLARLRQDMHAEMEKLGVRLGKIDDLSFFMDSPFGHMESHYKKAAVQLLPGSARQVVALLWREEWDFARELLEPDADSVQVVRFHGKPEDFASLSPADRVYRFGSGDQVLIHELPADDTQPYSTLERIR
jgi:DNA sulfur modification protein DndD